MMKFSWTISCLFLISCYSFLFTFVVSENESHSLRFVKNKPCPCLNKEWCKPITDTRNEIFVFSLKNTTAHWSKYDWSKITTVVMVGYASDGLMCMAHALNTRVSYIAKIDIDFRIPSLRKRWIQDQLSFMQEHYMDGINFDYESVIKKDDNLMRDAYTSLVAETNAILKKVLPDSQVSVDVAWRQNIDERFYDYPKLAQNSDFLFVMSYDEQSQIYGECVAMPNSGFIRTMGGLSTYIEAGIKKEQLVMGVPWYGYIYPCEHLDGPKCSIKPVPFRGASCSDAAGKQYTYSYIEKLSSIHTVHWNASSSTPYFSFTDDDGKNFQVQYDNVQSLTIKYKMAQKMKLKGVGMWNIDGLDYEDSTEGRDNRKQMFEALPAYNRS